MVSRLVMCADTWFTTPAVIFQPLSGLWLASYAGWPWTTPWILVSLILFLLIGACCLPVVWLQIQLRNMEQKASSEKEALPVKYWKYLKAWTLLGYPAFLMSLAIFYLMVFKNI